MRQQVLRKKNVHITRFSRPSDRAHRRSLAFPGRPLGHTNGPDHANPMIFFVKKLFYYWKINPQYLVGASPAAASPAGRPLSCSSAAPGGAAAAAPPRRLPGICSPPWPRAGTRHGRRPGRRGGGGRAKKGRDGARGARRHLPSRTSRPPDPAAAATGRARGRRIWPVPPSPRRASVRQRRRHGRALEEGAREGGVPGAADPLLRSSSSAHARRRRCPSRSARRRGRGGEGEGGGGAGEDEGGERGRSTSTTAEILPPRAVLPPCLAPIRHTRAAPTRYAVSNALGRLRHDRVPDRLSVLR